MLSVVDDGSSSSSSAPCSLHNVIVLVGEDLTPVRCEEFAWDATTGRITRVVTRQGHQPATPHRLTGDSDADAASYTKVVIPALYNAHTHIGDAILPDGATGLTLPQAFFRPDGFKYRELQKRTADEIVQAMTAHHHFMASSGTVAHCDFREQGVPGLRMLRRAEAASGVRAIICSQLHEADMDFAAPAQAELETLFTDTDECRGSDGFSESTMNDISDQGWATVRATTSKHGKLRAIHCLESPEYRTTSETVNNGRGDLERALTVLDANLIVHMTVANDTEIAAVAAAGTPVVLCPRANANLGLPIAPIAKMLDAGVPLLLGTDNVMLNPPNLFAEMDFVYKMCKSQYGDAVRPDPAAILRMASINAARVFRPKESLVGLVEGAPADFVVIDLTAAHVRNSQHLIASIVTRVTPADVLGTYRDGRCLYSRT